MDSGYSITVFLETTIDTELFFKSDLSYVQAFSECWCKNQVKKRWIQKLFLTLIWTTRY